ncbi:MAG: hypothetical protein JXA67_06520 [Micromonosporaceae bacterium]|nr:hypothetical protein [Micromonosporaceae bacterium]
MSDDASTTMQAALAHIRNDLEKRFPDVPEAVISDHVERARAQFAGVTVSEYVPVLVERQARQTLAALVSDAAQA